MANIKLSYLNKDTQAAYEEEQRRLQARQQRIAESAQRQSQISAVDAMWDRRATQRTGLLEKATGQTAQKPPAQPTHLGQARSGLTRDQYDAGVRSSYRARAAGSASVIGGGRASNVLSSADQREIARKREDTRKAIAAKEERRLAQQYFNRARMDLLNLDQETMERIREIPRLRESRNQNTQADLIGYVPEAREAAIEAWRKEQELRKDLRGMGYDDTQIDRMFDIASRGYNERTAAERTERMAEYAREHPAAATVESVPLNLASGAGIIDQTLQKLKTAMGGEYVPLDQNRPSMQGHYLSSAARGTIAGEIDDGSVGGRIGSFLYQTGTSMLDSAAAAAITATTGLPAAVLLGGSAATSAMADAKQRGGTDAQAILFGLASGAAEMIFEEISIEKLLRMEPGKGKALVKNALKQAFAEGSEEVNTSIANMISDALIMRDNAQLRQEYRAYLDSGLTEEQAGARVAQDALKGLGVDFLGGAVSGAVMGGGTSAIKALLDPSGGNTGVTARFQPEVSADSQRIIDAVAGATLPREQAETPLSAREAGAGNRTEERRTQPEVSREEIMRAVLDLMQPQEDTAAPEAAGQKNSATVTEAQSTAVNTDPAQHTTAEQRTITEYQNATDVRLKQAFEEYLDNPQKPFSRYTIGPVSEEQAADASQILGGDYTGYRNAINSNAIRHILREHGPFGTVNRSMADLNDAARIRYVLDNYDSVQQVEYASGDADLSAEFRTKENQPAPMLKYGKQVDGTYYVVEAIPESKYKKFWVVGAYMETGGGTQAPNANSPGNTPNASLASSQPVLNTIPQTGPDVNREQAGLDPPNPSVGAADYGFDPYSQWQNQSDTFHPAGEKAARAVDLPVEDLVGRPTMRTGRTIMESANTPDIRVGQIENMYVNGDLSYVPETNADLAARASAQIERDGWQTALKDWTSKVDAGKVSPDLVAMGAQLLNNMGNSGADPRLYADLVTDYSMLLHAAGQSTQAARILKMLTPEGRLYGVQRAINNINEQIKAETGIELDSGLMEEYRKAQTDEERDAILDRMKQDIADKMPSTLKDKWTALRYVNMLGNFRTQVRNILGNIAMGGLRAIKDEVGTAIEFAANRLSGGKIERTKSAAVGKQWMEAAKADFSTVEDAAMGNRRFQEGSTEQILQDIEEKRTIFKHTGDLGTGEDAAFAAKALRRVDDIGWSVLERYRKLTNWATDAGDQIFIKHHYARALAGYLKANGVSVEAFLEGNVDAALLDRARNYAIQEAQEATFHDNNTFSNWVSKIGRRSDTPAAGRVLSEGLAPFRKTPANVLVRAEEYSPLGLINTAVDAAKAVRGTGTASDVINSLSRTLTGTGLLLLGMALRSRGLIRATGEEGDEEIDGLMDRQDYSMILGDYSYTMDWLSPAMMPVFMGAILQDTLEDHDLSWRDVDNVIGRFADPILNMSMMSGLNDALSTVKYSENGLIQLASSFALGYLTQGLTNSLLGQIERASEENRVTTYVDQESDIPDWLQKAAGKASAKTPGWDYHQTEYLDAFGQTESNGSLGQRIIENLFSPGYLSKSREGEPVYDMLQSVHDVSGENPFPDAYAPKSITIPGEYGEEARSFPLTQAEREQYQQTRGQAAFDIMQMMKDLEGFRQMPGAQKADVLEKVNSLANEMAKAEWFEGRGMEYESSSDLKLVENGVRAEVLFAFKEIFETIDNGKDWVNDEAVQEITRAFVMAVEGSGVDYNGEGYSDARKAEHAGVTLRQYMAYKDSANEIKAGESATQEEAARALLRQDGLSNEQMGAIWQQQSSQWSEAKNPFTGTLARMGVSADTVVAISEMHKEIDGKDLKLKEKATAFARYLDGLNLSDAQQEQAEELYTYDFREPVTASEYDFAHLTDSHKEPFSGWAGNAGYSEERYYSTLMFMMEEYEKNKDMKDADRKRETIRALSSRLGSEAAARDFYYRVKLGHFDFDHLTESQQIKYYTWARPNGYTKQQFYDFYYVYQDAKDRISGRGKKYAIIAELARAMGDANAAAQFYALFN